MILRKYQTEAVSAALLALDNGQYPVLQLATGTGKSLILSAIAEHYRQRNKQVWVLTHVQQLVDQNAKTYRAFSGLEPAIICAGLKRRDTFGGVTVATIQSIKNPLLEQEIAPPDLIIIDEAHRVPHNIGEPGMYDNVFKDCPQAARVAMTATPWRMDNGIIYGEGEKFWFDTLAYKYTVPRAVHEGFLCPLVGVETEIQLDIKGVSIKGDFVQSDVGDAETDTWLEAVAGSLNKVASNRNHVAVYCPTVEAAKRTAYLITKVTGWSCGVITGDMTQDQRVIEFANFKTGLNKVLCSVDMITTGFDYPELDCIVCLRPTLSSSLWVQIQGRGTRLHPTKKNCLILDYVGNLVRLGGVDMYETFYRERDGVSIAEVKAVPAERKKKKVLPGLTTLVPIDPMTGKEARSGAEILVSVHEVGAIPIRTKRAPDRYTMLVFFTCVTKEGARIQASQFLDTKQPNKRTYEFFSRRSLAVRLPCEPNEVTWQVRNAKRPKHALVQKSGQYWNVVDELF
jgi:DNA repair protein RadD